MKDNEERSLQIQLQLLMLEDLLHMGVIDRELFDRAAQKIRKGMEQDEIRKSA